MAEPQEPSPGPSARRPSTGHYESLEHFWVRAHRVFVYVSEPGSGVNCGAALEDLTCKTSNTDGQAGSLSKAPSSCSYAAAMQDDPASSPSPASHPGAGPAEGAGSSCPVLVSDSGEQLHPLTRMPMALYSSEEQPTTSTTSTTPTTSTPAPTDPTRKRTWWRFLSRSAPADTAPITSTPPQPPTTASDPTTGTTDTALGLRRQRSTIPMAKPPDDAQLPKHQQGVAQASATQPVWMYPSEQMFYQAMKRKGWEPAARDMSTVVSIHNTVNERAWQEVCAWESLHCADCPSGPRLAKFQGRPADLSPKARFLNLLGYAPPFDRHDWTVDRCGKQVRYVIDFYSGVPRPGGPPAAMWLDTRPALDSFEAAWDRATLAVRWTWLNMWPQGSATPPPPGPPLSRLHQVAAGADAASRRQA